MADISIYLDDSRNTPPGYVRTFTVAETIDLLKTGVAVYALSLDNDLGDGVEEGYKVMDWLEEAVMKDGFRPPKHYYFHTHDLSRRAYMKAVARRIMEHVRKPVLWYKIGMHKLSQQTTDLFEKHNSKLNRWWILDANGNIAMDKMYETRPDDAQPLEDGDPFTPWHADYPHMHKDGGIHFKGTLTNARKALLDFNEGKSELTVRN